MSGRWAHALGHLGVVFFFVHTCLVLLLSLDREHGDEPFVTTKRFYIRRVFRIYPLYALCILAVVTFQIPESPLSTYQSHRITDVLLNFGLVQNLFGRGSVLSPLWSLPYEMQMYLALPALYFGLRRSSWRWTSAMALFGGALFAGYLLTGRTLWAWYYVPCFLCGAVAFCLKKRFQPLLPAWIWPVILTAIAIVYCVARRPGFHNEALRADAIAALLVGLAIPACREVKARRVTSVTHCIAQYSYGIYLSHLIAFWLAFLVLPLPARPLLQVSTGLAITVLVSVVCYHVIESPLIRTGKRISALTGLASERETAQAAAAV